MEKYIKNTDSQNAHTWGGIQIAASSTYQCQSEDEAMKFFNDSVFHSDLNSGIALISSTPAGNSTGDFSAVPEGLKFLVGVIIYDTPEPYPFAKPLYRTKDDATSAVVNVPINSSAIVDYQITEERFVSGGELIVQNTEIGDYIKAEVYDVDEVIPEAYRDALCESWPLVAKYIPKKWIFTQTSGGNSFTKIDTRPLNAKITIGLYLRVTYYAANSGSQRSVYLNYNLTKRL